MTGELKAMTIKLINEFVQSFQAVSPFSLSHSSPLRALTLKLMEWGTIEVIEEGSSDG